MQPFSVAAFAAPLPFISSATSALPSTCNRLRTSSRRVRKRGPGRSFSVVLALGPGKRDKIVGDAPEGPIDWSAKDAKGLPGPDARTVPVAFQKHIGAWEGTYTHLSPNGGVQDRHECRIEVGLHGSYHSQRNTYIWHDEDGKVTKTEVYDFPGKYDCDGVLQIETERISGWGRALDPDGTVMFYGAYKGTGSTGISPDTYDLIRIFDEKETLRYRTWQVKAGETLVKLVHVEERRVSAENTFWIPRSEQGE